MKLYKFIVVSLVFFSIFCNSAMRDIVSANKLSALNKPSYLKHLNVALEPFDWSACKDEICDYVIMDLKPRQTKQKSAKPKQSLSIPNVLTSDLPKPEPSEIVNITLPQNEFSTQIITQEPIAILPDQSLMTTKTDISYPEMSAPESLIFSSPKDSNLEPSAIPQVYDREQKEPNAQKTICSLKTPDILSLTHNDLLVSDTNHEASDRMIITQLGPIFNTSTMLDTLKAIIQLKTDILEKNINLATHPNFKEKIFYNAPLDTLYGPVGLEHSFLMSFTNGAFTLIPKPYDTLPYHTSDNDISKEDTAAIFAIQEEYLRAVLLRRQQISQLEAMLQVTGMSEVLKTLAQLRTDIRLKNISPVKHPTFGKQIFYNAKADTLYGSLTPQSSFFYIHPYDNRITSDHFSLVNLPYNLLQCHLSNANFKQQNVFPAFSKTQQKKNLQILKKMFGVNLEERFKNIYQIMKKKKTKAMTISKDKIVFYHAESNKLFGPILENTSFIYDIRNNKLTIIDTACRDIEIEKL